MYLGISAFFPSSLYSQQLKIFKSRISYDKGKIGPMKHPREKKKSDLRNTREKNFGSTNYPPEKISSLRNTKDGTWPKKLSTLIFNFVYLPILFIYSFFCLSISHSFFRVNISFVFFCLLFSTLFSIRPYCLLVSPYVLCSPFC